MIDEAELISRIRRGRLPAREVHALNSQGALTPAVMAALVAHGDLTVPDGVLPAAPPKPAPRAMLAAGLPPDPPFVAPFPSVFLNLPGVPAAGWAAPALKSAVVVPGSLVPGFGAQFDDATAINQAFTAAPLVELIPGATYNQFSPIVMPSGAAVLRGNGATLTDAAGFTGTALIKPGGSGQRVTGVNFTTSAVSFIDFANVFINYFECDHVTGTAGPAAADIFTNANVHRSHFHDMVLTQNNPAGTVWTLGSTGTGLSTTNFDNITAQVGVGVAGNRSAPAFSVYSALNKVVDALRFENMFCNNLQNGSNIDNTQYFFDIACTANLANNDFDRVQFSRVTFNAVLGGAIRVLSTWGIDLDCVDLGNMTAVGGKSLGNSIITVGTSGGAGQHSAAVNIRNYLREGTTALGAGVDPSDVSISADTQDVTITGPTSADSAVAVQINLNGCSGAQVITQKTGGGAGTAILNQNNTAGQKTIVIGQGAITVGGTAITVP